MSLSTDVGVAYSATGAAWQRGAGPIYDRLAERLVEACPIELAGARVLDLGAGTGAVTRAAARRGADVIAVDVAIGMLAADAASRPPAVAGDALALPFPRGAFDATAAAFSLNHLVDPVAGLREAARVVLTGGAVLAAAYSVDDRHPVRDAVEAAACARGWRPEPWYTQVREQAAWRLATIDRMAAAAHGAGLAELVVEQVGVAYPDLTSADLVAWRLGMAQLAPFVAALSAAEVDALTADAVDRLGIAPVLERSVIVLSGRVR